MHLTQTWDGRVKGERFSEEGDIYGRSKRKRKKEKKFKKACFSRSREKHDFIDV